MPIIDSRGFVDDGSSSLTVAGPVSATAHTTTSVSTLVSGSATLTAPGVFKYNGGLMTLPAPGIYPGALFIFSPSPATSSAGLYGGGLILTGVATVEPIVFASASGSIGKQPNVASQGTKLTIGTSGSVVLMSDGNYWLHMTSSGSLTFA